MSECSTTWQKQTEQITLSRTEAKVNTLARRDPPMPTIYWALLCLNNYSLLLDRDDFAALKLSR